MDDNAGRGDVDSVIVSALRQTCTWYHSVGQTISLALP